MTAPGANQRKENVSEGKNQPINTELYSVGRRAFFDGGRGFGKGAGPKT